MHLSIGDVLDGDRLLGLVEGMVRNGLLSNEGRGVGERIGHVLTGYIGSESFLRAVVSVVEKIKALNPACRYCRTCVAVNLLLSTFKPGDVSHRQATSRSDMCVILSWEIWEGSTSLGNSSKYT